MCFEADHRSCLSNLETCSFTIFLQQEVSLLICHQMKYAHRYQTFNSTLLQIFQLNVCQSVWKSQFEPLTQT